MAGFYRIYILGGQGGFQGADGANPLGLFVLVGGGNRQWLEPHYVDSTLGPLGKLDCLIPPAPDHPDMLLDAMLAFAPKLFDQCASLTQVEAELGQRKRLDFDQGGAEIPPSWSQLREEARVPFASLSLWQAEIVPLKQ